MLGYVPSADLRPRPHIKDVNRRVSWYEVHIRLISPFLPEASWKWLLQVRWAEREGWRLFSVVWTPSHLTQKLYSYWLLTGPGNPSLSGISPPLSPTMLIQFQKSKWRSSLAWQFSLWVLSRLQGHCSKVLRWCSVILYNYCDTNFSLLVAGW